MSINVPPILKSKGFWWTMAGITLIRPELLAPIVVGVGIYGVFKGTKAAIGKAANAINAHLAARRENERQRLFDEAYRRGATERERLRREAEVRAHEQRIEQRRREHIRALCQLLYFHFPALHAKRFVPDRFQQFVQTQLSDNQPAAVVEERGRELQRLLLQIGEQPPPAPATEDYVMWCRERIVRVSTLPLEARLKAEATLALHRSLVATEQLLAAREVQNATQTQMELRIPELLRDHERRMRAIRALAAAVDAETRKDLELDRLIEAEMYRFKEALLALTDTPG